MAKKKAIYRYFVQDKEGNPVNIDTLTEEERKKIGEWAYRKLLEGLGYERVEKETKEASGNRGCIGGSL